MTTQKKICVLATAIILVTFAAVALRPWERSFPGLSRTEVREIRAAVAGYALPSYSQCFSWEGVRHLPKVARIHRGWQVEDMRPTGDGSFDVRYTLQYSRQSATNLVNVRKRNGIWIITPSPMYSPAR